MRELWANSQIEDDNWGRFNAILSNFIIVKVESFMLLNVTIEICTGNLISQLLIICLSNIKLYNCWSYSFESFTTVVYK